MTLMGTFLLMILSSTVNLVTATNFDQEAGILEHT